LIHYSPLKIVTPQNDDICTSRRHQVNARLLEESLRTFFADRFRVAGNGDTQTYRENGRQVRREREREQGREKMLHGGGKKGWLVLSGRGICAPVSACIWETAMHLCMFRDYRMFLANNGLAVRSTGRKPEVLGRHFRRGLLAWSQVAFSRARIFSFVADE